MTTIKKPSPRLSSVRRFWIGAIVVGVLLVAYLLNSAWGQPDTVACLIYAILASAFLVAQLVGFVLSQTQYSEAMEEAKFRMLENEEAEWRPRAN